MALQVTPKMTWTMRCWQSAMASWMVSHTGWSRIPGPPTGATMAMSWWLSVTTTAAQPHPLTLLSSSDNLTLAPWVFLLLLCLLYCISYTRILFTLLIVESWGLMITVFSANLNDVILLQLCTHQSNVLLSHFVVDCTLSEWCTHYMEEIQSEAMSHCVWILPRSILQIIGILDPFLYWARCWATSATSSLLVRAYIYRIQRIPTTVVHAAVLKAFLLAPRNLVETLRDTYRCEKLAWV